MDKERANDVQKHKEQIGAELFADRISKERNVSYHCTQCLWRSLYLTRYPPSLVVEETERCEGYSTSTGQLLCTRLL